METVLLVLDESGAKGYDNNKEQHQGEFGVMAGFALPESKAEAFVSGLSDIVQSFATDGKLHITDLEPEAQETLRQRLFEYFSECRALWFYEAVYVQGFHEAHGRGKQLVEEALGARRSAVKLSSNPTKESLHGELFLGAFGSGLALTMDYIGSPVHLKVLTDRVDAPLLKKFEAQAGQLLNVGQPDRTEVTGFDTEKKEIVRGAIETSVVSGHDALGDFSGITYEIECDDNLLTLAADVLANSVHHHLKQIQDNTPGASLNSPEAIHGHPLQHLVYGAPAGAGSVNVADTIYRHPNSRKESGANDG
ncbi:hypothetical protein [Thioalkalivibrio sp. ALE17]|uniref:hypothetical protein n=1 Tax=Thioalkalivibrio sp. ALE17 TaxID=1158173 RepID=UPI0012DD0FEC|nr:hypothetical protein [Thioalkalivibrio sp. ALE17]